MSDFIGFRSKPIFVKLFNSNDLQIITAQHDQLGFGLPSDIIASQTKITVTHHIAL